MLPARAASQTAEASLAAYGCCSIPQLQGEAAFLGAGLHARTLSELCCRTCGAWDWLQTSKLIAGVPCPQKAFAKSAASVCVGCRLPEKDGGALLVSALQGFAKYFFQCEVCRWIVASAWTSSPAAGRTATPAAGRTASPAACLRSTSR